MRGTTSCRVVGVRREAAETDRAFLVGMVRSLIRMLQLLVITCESSSGITKKAIDTISSVRSFGGHDVELLCLGGKGKWKERRLGTRVDNQWSRKPVNFIVPFQRVSRSNNHSGSHIQTA